MFFYEFDKRMFAGLSSTIQWRILINKQRNSNKNAKLTSKISQPGKLINHGKSFNKLKFVNKIISAIILTNIHLQHCTTRNAMFIQCRSIQNNATKN